MPKDTPEQWVGELRQKATRALRQQNHQPAGPPSSHIQETIQELRIHQIELRMQNEELLRARQEAENERDRFAELYESLPVGCLTVDRDGVILEANRTSRTMLADLTNPLAGRSLADFILPDDQDRRFLFLRRVFNGRSSQQTELRFLRQDGSSFVAHVEAQAWLMSTAGTETCRLVLRDITSHKEIEDALRLQRDWLDVTLTSLGEGVIATNTTGIITFLNRAAETLTGWSSQEAIGEEVGKVLSFVHEHAQQPINLPIFEVLKASRVVEVPSSTALVARHGPKRDITGSGAPICSRDGTLHGVVLVLHDITKQKQLEDAVLNSRKIESVGVLAGGIAHDFNNLLTGIMGNVSLAKRFAERETQVIARLQEAEAACQRATALTHQLLAFSKGGVPVRQTISLTELLMEAVTFAQHGAKSSYDVSITDDLWSVDVDEGQIHQVIHNIVLNAIQAMPNGGHLQVRASNAVLHTGEVLSLPAGSYVQITVADHGCGIPHDILPNIFDPYFTTKEHGSGLGLATVYGIISKHDGTITVSSEVGRGTMMTVYLPAATGVAKPKSDQPAPPLHGNGRILVMDDEALIRDVLGAVLTSLGYTVAYASEGSEAIALYESTITAGKPFTALILDITIPGGMGGKEVVEHLRAVDPQVKAIVSSGYANDPIMADYAKYGFSGVMAKPYTVERVQEVLFRALQGNAVP